MKVVKAFYFWYRAYAAMHRADEAVGGGRDIVANAILCK